jgi:hypothetical protein
MFPLGFLKSLQSTAVSPPLEMKRSMQERAGDSELLPVVNILA